MNKSGFASEKVMRNYLNALLVDEDNPEHSKVPAQQIEKAQAAPQVKEDEMKPVAKLLEKVNVIEQSKPELKQQTPVKPAPVKPKIEVTTTNEVAQAIKQQPQAEKEQLETQKLYRQGDFQALFFDVAGLTVAVPLTELGGIHNMGKLNSLIGKPDWFMGVMVHRDHQLSIVNTAKWVMPEKYNIDLENNLEYQYIIMLDSSPWGLACEQLVNTVTLSQDDVKWMESGGKRPWLAGLIKERMCALLDVSALIEMLQQGLSTADQESLAAGLTELDNASE